MQQHQSNQTLLEVLEDESNSSLVDICDHDYNAILVTNRQQLLHSFYQYKKQNLSTLI